MRKKNFSFHKVIKNKLQAIKTVPKSGSKLFALIYSDALEIFPHFIDYNLNHTSAEKAT